MNTGQMVNITHYQRDDSQYHNEVLSHTGHNDHHPKAQTRNTGEGWGSCMSRCQVNDSFVSAKE